MNTHPLPRQHLTFIATILPQNIRHLGTEFIVPLSPQHRRGHWYAKITQAALASARKWYSPLLEQSWVLKRVGASTQGLRTGLTNTHKHPTRYIFQRPGVEAVLLCPWGLQVDSPFWLGCLPFHRPQVEAVTTEINLSAQQNLPACKSSSRPPLTQESRHVHASKL